MKIGDFLLTTLAVAIGSLIALAIAGTYAKEQITAATANNSTLSSIQSVLSLL